MLSGERRLFNFTPKAPFTISAATEEDIRWAASMTRRVYSGLDVIPTKLMLEWFEANPTGFFIIKDRDGHRCGNLDCLPLKPDTLAHLLRGEMIEREIRGDSLFRPQESERIDSLYIESLVALRSPLAAYKAIMNLPRLVARICAPGQIKKIYAAGASQNGIRLMKHLGFDRIECDTPKRDGHQVFAVSFVDLVKSIATHARSEDKLDLMRVLKEIEARG